MKNPKAKKKKSSILILSALFSSLLANQTSNQTTTERQNTHVHINSDLKHISCIESNCGKNKKHKTVKAGINRGHKAAGAFGIMPLTAKEIIKKDKKLMAKYGHLVELPHEELTRLINLNKTLDIELANSHWSRLSRLFPNCEIKRVHAWNSGIAGTRSLSEDQIHSHPYVRKFKKLKYIDSISKFSKVGARD